MKQEFCLKNRFFLPWKYEKEKEPAASMTNPIPRGLAIHDLSGFGRCSLTVILPVLSALGVQVCPLPTAVLSTHTGGFAEVAMRDLTDFLAESLSRYQELKLDFDCVYSGFLGSEDQIDICADCLSRYPGALKVVDPVMGDHGKPYRTYTAAMQRRMGELARHADLITPNLTEACMLLGQPYRFAPLGVQEAKTLLLQLADLGPSTVVLTGVQMESNRVTNLGYDRNSGSFWRAAFEHLPVNYPGTGDLYCSVLIGGLLKGDSLPIAMERAGRFVELAMKTTFSYHTDPRYGVMLETALPLLWERERMDGFESF